ncbi:hypothetical protein NPIL_448621 [Nephila pilipes]|uniref:Uncharacterized protein n=1 Tax=Nephila pilipes TaxID=299642 RepID=A0A8X6IM19_NEPPI|nr:hypothetical protein NPIL_448621 [Nephila pilipes]
MCFSLSCFALTYAFADCGWSLRLFHGASPLSPSGASEKRSSSSACEAFCWNLVPCGSLVSLAYFRLLLSAEVPVFPVSCCVPSFVDELFHDDLDLPVFYFTRVL